MLVVLRVIKNPPFLWGIFYLRALTAGLMERLISFNRVGYAVAASVCLYQKLDRYRVFV